MKCVRGAIVGLVLGTQALPAWSAEGGGASSLIQPQVGTIFWTLITFLVLAWLLGRVAWKPLLGALEEREKTIQESIEQAQREREQAEGLLKEQRELVAQARRERAEALKRGQAEGEKLRAEILSEARQQKEQVLQQTQAQIEAGLRQARGELRAEAADLAIRAAEKLLAQNLDAAAQRRLVEEYLADLEASDSPGSTPS